MELINKFIDGATYIMSDVVIKIGLALMALGIIFSLPQILN